jgi:preprotein translocase subunit SecD
MPSFPRWKIILVLAICLFGLYHALPNLLPAPAEPVAGGEAPGAGLAERILPSSRISLGLDLQGGVHLLLKVGVDEALADQMQGILSITRQTLSSSRIGYTGLRLSGRTVSFNLRDASERDEALGKLRGIAGDLTVAIDEQGAGSLTLTEDGAAERARAIVSHSIEIVRRRVDALGTTEPLIQRQGTDRIVLQIPGVSDPERVKEILGHTAKMTFHIVNESADPGSPAPYGSMKLPLRQTDPEAPRSYLIVKQDIALSGEHLVDAHTTFDPNMPGRAQVAFKFDATGARIFSRITTEHQNERFAIVLDDEIISAPVIEEPITGGSGVIRGDFSAQETNDLSLLLRAGALPAPLQVLEERSVGASLGEDSVQAGKVASLVGFLLITLFMVLCYGFFGLIADLALVVNMVLLFAVLSMIHATLTLPGVAGIVLTMGMAVDANVLIYERIREEIRNGRSPMSAVDAGFDRAFTTIVDANLTHVIAAFFLFLMGSGPVKGFAVTLLIGVLTSMFTATTFTRLVVATWMHFRRPKTLAI